mmetsp:Transcript_12646/g.19232  ORF Transcript_12646/g.19232 Transcript_12646/m.19232 type:complete len:96 (-) Transcript_12646:1367-1654(-)
MPHFYEISKSFHEYGWGFLDVTVTSKVTVIIKAAACAEKTESSVRLCYCVYKSKRNRCEERNPKNGVTPCQKSVIFSPNTATLPSSAPVQQRNLL